MYEKTKTVYIRFYNNFLLSKCFCQKYVFDNLGLEDLLDTGSKFC